MKRINASFEFLKLYLATNPSNAARTQREQAQREQAQTEQAQTQREQAQREQAQTQREQAEKEKAEKEKAKKAAAEAKAKAEAEVQEMVAEVMAALDQELSRKKRSQPEPCGACFVPHAGITITDTFRKFVRHLEGDHRLSIAQIRRICGGVSETTLRGYETRGPTKRVCGSIKEWIKNT